MTKPVRIQLLRKRGFRLEEASLAANGLLAMNVARPGRWGNPWKVKVRGRFHDTNAAAWAGAHDQEINYPFHRTQADAARRAAECYESALCEGRLTRVKIEEVTELRGSNLACWCSLDMPCHADVLLRLANPETIEDVHG
ncbi:hypothetical protein AM571_CH01397 [Rhizobium etli 8C-3]|uniref:DUF4326 domain-containing protein n=1 Tax=Rhizobium etli 8C-3 TaxID=538025 RepID=A0A1L5P256_RHIET|nr:DUF4326 domain-containing protein [Rhizobium etli]APO74233.1 hypothetical protein AM571_CH01397 [Rhizobium etli 8C-3]